MIRLSLFLILLLSVSSCITIGFENPQPAGRKNLDEFPQAMLGSYDDDPNGRKAELEILDNSVILEDEEALGQGRLYLSDTLQLRKYKKFFVANWWNSGEKCWDVHPFRKTGDRLFLYSIDLNKEEANERLSAYTPIVRRDENLLVVNPSRRVFGRMLKDPELWKVDTLYRFSPR